MQKIINKINILNDTYYKTLNVINDQIVHINIHKQVGTGFREVLPVEVDDKIKPYIMSNKNDIPLNNEELKKFSFKIDDIRDSHKRDINTEVVKRFNAKGSVKLLSSFSGITYCVVEFIDKPYAEVVKITLDENGGVRDICPLTHIMLDLIIADISTKLLLKNKSKFIQITHTTIYGIKREGNSVIITELSIGAEDINCIKSYGILVKDNNYRFYRHDEVTEKVKNKIQEITTTIIEDLMRAVLLDLLKHEKDE